MLVEATGAGRGWDKGTCDVTWGQMLQGPQSHEGEWDLRV